MVSASTGADELAMGTLLAAGTMEESSYYRTIAKDGVDEAQLDSVRQVIAYDMNGDELQDVVALSGTDGHISWFENGGAALRTAARRLGREDPPPAARRRSSSSPPPPRWPPSSSPPPRGERGRRGRGAAELCGRAGKGVGRVL